MRFFVLTLFLAVFALSGCSTVSGFLDRANVKVEAKVDGLTVGFGAGTDGVKVAFDLAGVSSAFGVDTSEAMCYVGGYIPLLDKFGPVADYCAEE
ncbi:hypothetical protein LCGC14_1764740 [marine sediment metagenome]|uniref:Lipoprotein n=1 Tax=marine sediment metagenome TaxID=412755 RepID=A0A0F9JEZ9_9ZZZZ